MNRKEKIKAGENISWLLKHITRYPFIVIIFLIVAFLCIYYQNNSSIYLGKIFDSISSFDKDHVKKYLELLLLFSVCQGVLDLFSSYSILLLRLNMEKDVRKEIYTDLLKKDQCIYDVASTGDIMALATNEIRNISTMFQPGFLIAYKSILSYIIPICFIIKNFNVCLSIGPILFSVISLILLLRYSRNVNEVTREERQRFGKMNSYLNEVIEGIEVVKSGVQENNEKDVFYKKTESIVEKSMNRVRLEAGFKPTLIFALFFGIALFQALKLYISGAISVGSLLSYITIYLNLKYPISNAEISFSLIGQGFASVERVVSLLKNSVTMESGTNAVKDEVKGSIEFRNVSFGYLEGKKALKNINFKISPSEVVAIVGSTGSGKSTITKLVNRTYDIDEGEILIDGHNIKNWDIKCLRSAIGVIEQDIFLFSWSLLKNIKFGSKKVANDVSLESVRECARQAFADDFIMDFKDQYQTMVGERGIQLSGGQRQRTAIARALLMDPRILILDDSTSAVDSKTEEEIRKGIKNVVRNRTTILITHRLSQITQADKIIMMKNGEVLAQGCHEELINTCREYREMYSEYL